MHHRLHGLRIVTDNKKLDLIKGLGPWATMAMVVGHIIGTGVFLKPREMADATHSVGLIFVVWIVGGLLSIAGALSLAELGAAMPQAGGPYVYLTRGLGPRWGFMFGWMNNLVGKPSSISTIAAGFLIFLSFFFPWMKETIVKIPIPVPGAAEPYMFNFTWAQPLAALAIIFMTSINYLGVRLAGRLQVVLTTIKVSSILAVVILGFALAEPGAASAWPVFPAAFSGSVLAGFFVAMAGAMWAYDGWIDITYAGSEVQNPQRNLPLAVVGGTVIVGVIYMLANAIYFYVLPVERVATVQNVASETVRVFAGENAAAWITAAMVISAFTTLNSSILTGARVPFAMAREGLFFRKTATIHPQFHTPAGALVFQGAFASVMVLTGGFDELANLYIFVQWIFYALTVASLFGLRKREPDLPRPYRAPGYPVLPVLFILGALGLTVSLFLNMPGRSTVGLAIMLSGLFFYNRWKDRRLA